MALSQPGKGAIRPAMTKTAPHTRTPDLTARPSHGLASGVRVPGDKSISHRALILGALAVGRTTVTGLLEGADVMATAAALRAFGAHVGRGDDGTWRIDGVGVGGLRPPADIIDMGNSGTGVRLLMGLAATHDLTATFTGDDSLRRRPMARVTEPLIRMGARFEGAEGDRLPLTVIGTADPLPITYESPVASAQVKSAVLLAGLNTPGTTTVIERQGTRDHTERLLSHFGAAVTREETPEGVTASVTGYAELTARDVDVPADISSAAFPLVAALVTEDSDILLETVGINPLRAGLLTTLAEMGADIQLENERFEAGEPVADIRARSSRLTGVDVPPERAPAMIDEYPVLAVAAACAKGKTTMHGVGELRVKESDRLMAMARVLSAAGIKVTESKDSLTVEGGRAAGGFTAETFQDHRIAMAALVLGLAADAPIGIDSAAMIETSFPGFADLMRRLGADIAPGTGP